MYGIKYQNVGKRDVDNVGIHFTFFMPSRLVSFAEVNVDRTKILNPGNTNLYKAIIPQKQFIEQEFYDAFVMICFKFRDIYLDKVDSSFSFGQHYLLSSNMIGIRGITDIQLQELLNRYKKTYGKYPMPDAE